MAIIKNKAKPIRIDFEEHRWDAEVRDLAAQGLYATTIQNQIPELTIYQVRLRVRRAGYTRAFRRGESEEARVLISRCERGIKVARELLRRVGAVRRKR